MLGPGVIRVTAPNPSPLTAEGTNTYIVGNGPVVIIDPGPALDTHRRALLDAVTGREVAYVLVTHWHRDHSELAAQLAQDVTAPVWAFGTGHDGRSQLMQKLAAAGGLGGGEGIDDMFAPDAQCRDGAKIAFGSETMTALHTPGHHAGHLSFAWRDLVFSGDHVMGWSTTLISPPDGDLTQFMASCRRLLDHGARVLHPGHGAPVMDPTARITELMDHRQARDTQVIAALETAPATPREITERVYKDVPQHLWLAAERNVLAHLIALTEQGIAKPQGALCTSAKFFLT